MRTNPHEDNCRARGAVGQETIWENLLMLKGISLDVHGAVNDIKLIDNSADVAGLCKMGSHFSTLGFSKTCERKCYFTIKYHFRFVYLIKLYDESNIIQHVMIKYQRQNIESWILRSNNIKSPINVRTLRSSRSAYMQVFNHFGCYSVSPDCFKVSTSIKFKNFDIIGSRISCSSVIYIKLTSTVSVFKISIQETT